MIDHGGHCYTKDHLPARVTILLLKYLIHEIVFEFCAIIQQYVSGHIWTGSYWFMNEDTMISADLSIMGKGSGHPVR